MVELTVAVAIMGILAAVAVPSYLRYTEELRISKAIEDIRSLEVSINSFELLNGELPKTLAEVRGDMFRDPWGNPYEYLRSQDDGKTGKNGAVGQMRKDRNLHPLNTDYDLYSMGKDGKSSPPINSHTGQDDIIRANNGAFVGLASDY